VRHIQSVAFDLLMHVLTAILAYAKPIGSARQDLGRTSPAPGNPGTGTPASLAGASPAVARAVARCEPARTRRR